MFKQVRFTLLSLLVLLAFGANRAFANGTLVDGVYYIFDEANRTATVTYSGPSVPAAAGDNSGYSGDVVVPGSVYYNGYEYTVTTIGEGAFKFASINSLVVGEGCTTIAGSSFNNANIAVSMTLPSTVTTISGAGDNGAGSTCPTIIIGSLEKGSQLTAINGSFMYNANVNDVYMYGTNPATTVGAYAFSKAPKIHVPDISLALYQACGWAKDGWSRTRNFVGDINVPMSWEDFQANVATYVAKGVKKGDSPNTFAEGEEVNAYLAALDAAKAMTEGTSSDDMKAAVKTLENTYAALPAALPLTEGYYYMVNNYEAYNEKYGVYPAIFTAPEFVRSSGASACLFDKFDANNANYIYKLTAKEGLEGGFYAQNAATGWYLNTGDGDTWYGEVTTCSETAVNAQIFKAYGVGNGAFWVADETDTNVSRAISGAASVPSRNYVFGWTTFADVVADNLKGYNTWTLIPVAEETVTTLVAKAEEEKAAKAAILAELEPLYASLADLATAVNNGEAPYDTMNEEVVANFKNAYATAKTLIAIKKYNHGVSSESYTNGLANLKAAKQALIEATPVDLEDGYYYIVNAAPDFKNNHEGQNAAMCIDVAGEPIKWALFDNSQEKFVMEIKKQESGNYFIKGYSTGAYFASTENPDTYSAPVFTSVDAPVEQIIKHYEKYSEGAYVIHNVVNSWDWHPEGNNGGAGTSGRIVGWPAYMSEVSTWNFIKVTDEDWAAINQGKRTEEAKAILNEANLALLDNVTEWTTNATLIKSDASNLSTNAASLDLGKLINGELSETTETWSKYPSSDAYLQVEIDDADLCSNLRLSIAPRTGQYYKADTPKSWIVTKSDDGENWSYVGEYQTDPDAIAVGQLFTYPVINLGSTAKYVRFTSPVAIENRTGKTTHFALGEFKLESVSAAATIDDANVSTAYTALVNAVDELRQAVDANTVTAEQKTAFETAYDTYAAAITEYNIPGGVWEIASEATAPAAGKTYAIKNVTNANYLTMKGVEDNVNVLNNTGVWTLEATGEQEDGLDTYYFKSVDNGLYWKKEDWANEPEGYDGFDIHGYAGLNTYFTANTDEAIKITVAACGSTGDWRSADGGDKGFILATAYDGKQLRLGQQRGTDATFEPYKDELAWEFYEATFNKDIRAELAAAISAYNIDIATATTGDKPGYYNADNIAAYSAALTAAQDITDESTKKEVRDAIDALAAAYDVAKTPNPIVEGYYYVVSAGKGSGYPASDDVKFDDEERFALYNEGGIVKWKMWDESFYNEIYYFTSDGEGNWFAKNLVDNTYINKGTGSYSCNITTSAEAVTSQTFIPSAVVGKFAAKFKDNPYAYALTASHNGAGENTSGTLNIWGSPAEANNCKMNLWFLIPVSEENVNKAKESVAAGLGDLIASYKATEIPTGEYPGLTPASAVEVFATAIAEAEEVAATGTTEEKIAATYTLKNAYTTCINTVNPIVDGGIYYIINDNAKIAENGKSEKAMYIDADAKTVRWAEKVTYDDTFAFKFTDNGDGTYNIQNVKTGLYTGEATAFCGTVPASEEAKAVKFTCYNGTGSYYLKCGTWTYCPKGNPAGTADGPNDVWAYNGEGTANGNYPHLEWTWRLVPFAEATGGVWEIAAESAAPAAGKTYAIKSVTKANYLTMKGVEDKVNVMNNTGVWTLEATGEQEDGLDTYYFKSVDNGLYWKKEDWANEPEGYDGFDIHGYAGLNTYFTDNTAEAIKITVAACGSTDNWRSADGGEQGYILATAYDGKQLRLGQQRGTDATFEPYKDELAWEFYEATFNSDIRAELAAAVATYNIDLDAATTGDKPGYYNTEKIAAYSAALTAAQGITDESKTFEVRNAIDALAAAYAEAKTTNPIVEGYYYVVSAGKGSGYPASDEVKYDDEERYALYNEGGIVKWKMWDESIYNEIYYLTSDGEGNWFVKNLIDNTYINRGTGTYSCNITTSAEAVTSQTFEPSSVVGKFTAKFNGNPYAYALTASHNGSKGSNGDSEATSGTLNIWGSPAEASNCKMNLWFLIPVSEENVNKAKETLAAGLSDLIAEVEAAAIEGSDKPGYYVQANVDALNAAVTSAKNVLEGTIDEKLAAIESLKTAYAKATTEYNPITEGYYYIVSKYAAYKTNFGAPAALYAAADDVRESGLSNVRFDTFDANNANFIFKITPKADVEDAFYVQSAYNDYYLNTGDGTNWYGEVTTCTSEALNAQLFRNYGLGQYWIADETDTRVSRCVRKTGAKNGTIYGWTTIGDNIAEADLGYNAWELIAVSADDVAAIIAAQESSDVTTGTAYTDMTTYVSEIQETYDSYVNNAELSEAVKSELTEAYGNYTAAAAAANYDITSSAATYNGIKAALAAAMEKARLEITGVNGIAAGGNASVSVSGNGLTVTATADTTINVVGMSGLRISKFVAAGETVTISLVPGVYSVNGKKYVVK